MTSSEQDTNADRESGDSPASGAKRRETSRERAARARRADRIALPGNIIIAMIPTLMLLYFMVVYDWWASMEFWYVAAVTATIAWFAPPMGRSLGNKGCWVLLPLFIIPQLVAAYVPVLKPYVGVYFIVFFTFGAWRGLYDVYVKRVQLF